MNRSYAQTRKLHTDMQNLHLKFDQERTVPSGSTPEEVTSSGGDQVNVPPNYRNDLSAHTSTFSDTVTRVQLVNTRRIKIKSNRI
jgi:hypothetical protein